MNYTEFKKIEAKKLHNRSDLLRMYCYLEGATSKISDELIFIEEHKQDAIEKFDKQIKEKQDSYEELKSKEEMIRNNLAIKWGVIL